MNILSHGFLGNGASLMLDVVVVALVLVVPVLAWSLYEVKVRRNFQRHKLLQMTLGIVLLAAVLAFEVDMRLQGGWEQIINRDPESPRLLPEQLAAVKRVLMIHLIFAVSTPFLWAATMILAVRRFAQPPVPGEHSQLHKTLGWLSVLDLTATSVTGLWFYYVAFVASA
jgi:uncharacterized membrane protein YwzB